MMKNTLVFILFLLICNCIYAQKSMRYQLSSPDNRLQLTITTGDKMRWSLQFNKQQIITPSSISMELSDGVAGNNVTVVSSNKRKVNTSFEAINYIRKNIKDQYNELSLTCRGDFSVIFRAYDDAVAYRFVTKKKGELIVTNEQAEFNFTSDHKSFYPVQWDYRGGKTFNSSFEALYRETRLSAFPKDSLAFLPVLVEASDSVKALILEADLEDYPGMYVDINSPANGFKGVFAPYPLEAEVKERNFIPTRRAAYIAKTTGTRNFPWRVVVISTQDRDLLDQDIIQKLASPSRISDVSWIQPGQVAWDWWNNWNIKNVDFKAGINTKTYKYYIDFAAANKIQYIVMDEGWSDNTDLLKISPQISLQEIVEYGKQKNVGVILWATWYTVTRQMNNIFPLYATMGIKGFKIDFIDRDDQVAVASTYQIAKIAAENKLMIDYHGVFKPTGLQRTYPNVIGYEGVKGLENYKWADEDQPRYAVTIPFIRMVAGMMDYTPGALRNANQANFRPINDNPMSKGTRCHQLAMYIVYDAPLQMLSDNPTAYMQEKECTDFITKVPTTFEETVPLDGTVAEKVAIARRNGDNWYVGAMTNWTARELTLDFSFLPAGRYQAEIFSDGVNADRDGTDYKREMRTITAGEKMLISLSSGGGWAARISPAK